MDLTAMGLLLWLGVLYLMAGLATWTFCGAFPARSPVLGSRPLSLVTWPALWASSAAGIVRKTLGSRTPARTAPEQPSSPKRPT